MEPATEDHGPVLSSQEAKQGRSGKRIFIVLTVSLLLVVIALAVAYMGWLPALDAAETSAPPTPPPITDQG